MIEITLAITNLLLVVAVLTYFYLREIKQTERLEDQIFSTQGFFEEMNQTKDNLIRENFKNFLAHIKHLEEMVLPKPVTRSMVDDIMLRTPPLSENEIEKNPEEINQENFMDVFSKIPINANTKVVFENEIEGKNPQEEII